MRKQPYDYLRKGDSSFYSEGADKMIDKTLVIIIILGSFLAILLSFLKIIYEYVELPKPIRKNFTRQIFSWGLVFLLVCSIGMLILVQFINP